MRTCYFSNQPRTENFNYYCKIKNVQQKFYHTVTKDTFKWVKIISSTSYYYQKNDSLAFIYIFQISCADNKLLVRKLIHTYS